MPEAPECVASPETGPILLFGSWQPIPAHLDKTTVEGVEVFRCTQIDELPGITRKNRPSWLLVGLGVDDYDAQQAIALARSLAPEIRLALLGPTEDSRRCDTWLRRGCDAYLDSAASPSQVVSALLVDTSLDLRVVHRSFHRYLSTHRPDAPSLTRRETEVLYQLRHGRSNREIAAALHVSENTVEYHVRNLLAKFRARNRLRAVERAAFLGLV